MTFGTYEIRPCTRVIIEKLSAWPLTLTSDTKGVDTNANFAFKYVYR